MAPNAFYVPKTVDLAQVHLTAPSVSMGSSLSHFPSEDNPLSAVLRSVEMERDSLTTVMMVTWTMETAVMSSVRLSLDGTAMEEDPPEEITAFRRSLRMWSCLKLEPPT